ncbi:MAG: IS4 family transposase [Pseudomonadales bacterium]
MNTNHKLANLQHRIKKHAEQVDAFSFFNLLTSQQLLSTVEGLLPEYRERKYPPTETLSMFLSQAMSADRSCQHIVNTMVVQRLTNGLPLHSTFTGSYCKARQRLPTDMISELVRCTGQLIENQLPKNWHWQGRPVKLVDGTTVTMPDTPENQAIYPQQKGQKPGLGFPICRIVGIMCLASGSVLNAAIGPYKGKGADEQTLLRGMLDSFESGDIVLGDAYFASYFLLAELMARDIDAVFEQFGARRKSADFRKGQRLGAKDHLITYEKPKKKPDWMTKEAYQAAPSTLTLRELKVDKKILVTTLLSPKYYSKNALKILYQDRWHVELNLRNIKTTMGMETFSCKTPEMIEKEMWIYLLAYNLIRLVMVQSASLADLLPRQISFKHTLQIWLAYRHQQGTIDNDKSLNVLCVLIAENCVGHRPGRIEPRAVKRRPKPYPLLMKPRSEARETVKKYGHPRKQK